MQRTELAESYFDAWNRKDAEALLKLFHPQASYHDAFWGEACCGTDLKKYFRTELETEQHWYRIDGDIVPTPYGLIVRYLAFRNEDEAGVEPLYNGAEILTISRGLIRTISEHYCDPTAENLKEIAGRGDARHERSDVAPAGLSNREASRIKRRLKELATETGIYLDPSLTVTRLADHVGCSVMHLFHVLEQDMEMTFVAFVQECRSRYASSRLVDEGDGDTCLDEIARDAGFASVQEFYNAFKATFGMAPADYLAQFRYE